MTSAAPLSPHDLPLGTLEPDASYNQLLAAAIAADKQGQAPTAEQIIELQAARQKLWSRLSARKAEGMESYARYAAAQYDLPLDDEGRLTFSWKTFDHRRVGYESDFYTCDLESRSLVPVSLKHSGPRVIVFATGRAFAEKNSRLAHLSTNEAILNARNVMSAQVYLVGSRLVPDYPDGPSQVAAVAYDMVTSEVETPAIRIQSILDPDYIHPAARMVAERIFGELIADAEFNDNGTFVRNVGIIKGQPLPADDIITNLSGLVLVGGSVGCSVSHQVYGWLRCLLSDLNVVESTVDEAMKACLNIHLGPTTVLPADKGINRLSVINKSDEFVFAGNDIDGVVRESEATGSHFVPDRSGDHAASEFSGQSYHLVLDVPSTFHHGPDGTVFDPIGTHFGHSLKHYSNGLRQIGLGSVVGRALDHQGSFQLRDLIQDAEEAGELQSAIDGH